MLPEVCQSLVSIRSTGKQGITLCIKIVIEMVGSSSCAHLQHGPVVVQVVDVLEQTPPDANVVEGHAHPSARQRMPHVVRIAQEKHACNTTDCRLSHIPKYMTSCCLVL